MASINKALLNQIRLIKQKHHQNPDGKKPRSLIRKHKHLRDKPLS